LKQELALTLSFRQAPVGANDAMPGEASVRGREDTPDESRRAGVDISIGADKPNGDRADTIDDVCGARLESVRLRLS
jgi:hypothetical protein